MIVVKYSFFAVVSIMVNLATQYCVDLAYYGRFGIYASLSLGTATGMITKYVCDKRFIFYHKTESLRDDFRVFSLYLLMGIFTTALFWGVELAFNHMFVFHNAKLLGGFVGLSMGYYVKYRLDNRFVFTDADASQRKAS